jgi:predicted ATPase
MSKIADIFHIPERVHQGDFVLKLTEGVRRPEDTLRSYVVTPQLVHCFDQALSLIRAAVETNTNKGAYLHGSFGSGKSHFMAVLSILLQNHPGARSIPQLAEVVSRRDRWTGRAYPLAQFQ